MYLHTCQHGHPVHGPAEVATGNGAGTRAKPRAFTVDLHAHVIVPEVEALVKDRPEKQAEGGMQVRMMGAASVEHNSRKMLPEAFPKLTSLEQRLRDMDKMGVDVQVISPTSVQHYYWADVDLARDVVRVCNEKIAQSCAQHPDRLAALGNVALQHPELAVEQLEYCVRELGMRGVEISTSIAGRELDDPSFERFWAKVEALGCLVFIHPFGTSLGERVNRFYLANIIGQPIETTIALSHLIFGGVLDRYPGVKICAAHGGGYLPAYIGRSDHGYRVRPEAQGMKRAPSEYLRQIWFDNLIYSSEAVGNLIEQVGVSQVVVGTDYPFDMGAYDVHELVAGIAGLTEQDRAAILGGNAAQLLGLKPR